MMDRRKEALKIVRSCLLFVLKSKVLEPELVKVDFDSLIAVINKNLI